MLIGKHIQSEIFVKIFIIPGKNKQKQKQADEGGNKCIKKWIRDEIGKYPSFIDSVHLVQSYKLTCLDGLPNHKVDVVYNAEYQYNQQHNFEDVYVFDIHGGQVTLQLFITEMSRKRGLLVGPPWFWKE